MAALSVGDVLEPLKARKEPPLPIRMSIVQRPEPRT
jgi:hypothetical protein